jgi:hypothetical protein
MSIARHDPDAYFESQGGWPELAAPNLPDDWTPLDALYFEEWSVTIDLSVPPPEPEDLGEPSGSWFDDEVPDHAKDTRPIRPGPQPGPRSAA